MRLHMLQLLNCSFVSAINNGWNCTQNSIQSFSCCFFHCFTLIFKNQCFPVAKSIEFIFITSLFAYLKWNERRKNNSSIRMFGLSVLNVPMIYGPNEKSFEFQKLKKTKIPTKYIPVCWRGFCWKICVSQK